MTAPIRIGIVGCGRILPAHLRGMRLLREAGRDDFRVTALVARRADAALAFRRRGEGPPQRNPVTTNPNDALGAPQIYVSDFQPEESPAIFTSVDAMLASGLVDAVSITATVGVHHTLGLPVLDAGKHLMVEKPLAITVRAGQLLVDVAERNGLALGVMEVVRYDEVFRIARWLIDRGELGDVQMIASVAIGTGDWSPDRVVGNTPWRHRKVEAGGGASLDIGVHLAHDVRYLAGEVRAVSALTRIFEPEREVRGDVPLNGTRHRADVDDAFFALLDFESGAAGMLSFTWAGHGEPTSLPGGLTIYGTRGCVKGPLLVRDGGERVDLREHFAATADAADVARVFPWGIRERFGQAYADWLDAIHAGGQPETNGMEGLRDLATAYAIPEASLAGRPVRVDDVLRGEVAAYQQEINAYYRL